MVVVSGCSTSPVSVGDHEYVLYYGQHYVRGFDYFLKDMPLLISRHTFVNKNGTTEVSMNGNRNLAHRVAHNTVDINFVTKISVLLNFL